MPVRIASGFDFRRTGAMSMRITENTGGLQFSVLFLSTGIWYGNGAGVATSLMNFRTAWCHEDLTSITGSLAYDDLAPAIKEALDAGSLDHGNSRIYTVTWNAVNQTYTISVAGDTIVINFGVFGAAGERMRLALGYAGTTPNQASHVSTLRPYYSIVPKATGLSIFDTDNEQSGLIEEAVAGGGSQYSTGPLKLPVLFDCTFFHESVAAGSPGSEGTGVKIADTVGGLVPWTWEHFFEHHRAVEPFRLDPGSGQKYVVKLRADGAHFDPPREAKDWNMWRIPIRGRLLGRI